MGGRSRVGVVFGIALLSTSAVEGLRGQSAASGPDSLVDPIQTASSWSFKVGLARYGLSDGLASPFPHDGTGLLLGVGYGVPDREGGWGVALSYWAPRLTSSIETRDGGFETTHQVDLGFVWLETVGSLGRVGMHLGGALDGRFSFRSHHYTEWRSQSRVERFGDLFVPLQLAGMWSVPVGERGLVAHRLGLPVVTLAFRSPYTGLKYFPPATVESPFSTTGFDSRLAYRRRGSGWGFGVFHHLTFVRYPDPRPLTSVVHRIGLEILR